MTTRVQRELLTETQPPDRTGVQLQALAGTLTAANAGEMYTCIAPTVAPYVVGNIYAWNGVGFDSLNGGGGVNPIAYPFPAQSTWTVTHNLGKIVPFIIIDDTNEVFTPSQVTTIQDANQIELDWNGIDKAGAVYIFS